MRLLSLLIAISAGVAACRAFVVVSPPSICDRYNTQSWYTQEGKHLCSEQGLTNESVELRTLYPSVAPYRNGTIAVDDTHTLFYQEYGQEPSNKKALTALFLHGGPGAGCSPNHARFMDPSKYRIILLDQRGSGQSTPLGEVQKNTLLYLVQDCETIRKELEIDRWDLVLGGSWGSTLALAYAQEYPQSVRSLVLRGVCLLRPCEVDWLTSNKGGSASLDPKGWKEFSSAVGVELKEGNDRAVLHAYYDRLLGDDPVARIEAARSWMRWEMQVSSSARGYARNDENPSQHPILVWEPNGGQWSCQDNNGMKMHNVLWHESHMLRRGVSLARGPLQTVSNVRPVSPVPVEQSRDVTVEEAARYIPAQPMLTCFYSANDRYAMDNLDLLCKERLSRVRSIPCIAVQGGKDTICPPDTALDLRANWPEMELRIPKGSGHSMYDPAITNELVQATDRIANEFGAKS
jgi:proline iminopeptidase